MTFSRRESGDNILFDRINHYHSNIKLTTELNPSKFLDTNLTNINGSYKFSLSEPEKHFRSNVNHCFTWAVISNLQKMLRPGRT